MDTVVKMWADWETDYITAGEIAIIAEQGGSFDFLLEEGEDIYDEEKMGDNTTKGTNPQNCRGSGKLGTIGYFPNNLSTLFLHSEINKFDK